MNTLKHLACIMDGNRRWAKKEGVSAAQGYQAGVLAAKRVMEFCLERAIPYLSFYTLSSENLQRSPHEIEAVFAMLVQEADRTIQESVDQNVRIRFVGDRALIPAHIAKVCDRIEQETAHCTKLHVDSLFGYGSRQEIVHATRVIAHKIAKQAYSVDMIDENLFERHLWTHGVPMPDIIVRTGFHHRLSNFLLYQAAYAELYFPACLWPDITHEMLDTIINEFNNNCQRNLGK